MGSFLLIQKGGMGWKSSCTTLNYLTCCPASRRRRLREIVFGVHLVGTRECGVMSAHLRIAGLACMCKSSAQGGLHFWHCSHWVCTFYRAGGKVAGWPNSCPAFLLTLLANCLWWWNAWQCERHWSDDTGSKQRLYILCNFLAAANIGTIFYLFVCLYGHRSLITPGNCKLR